MKSRVVKQVNVVFEKDEKESIKKVITLINNLIDIGNSNNCDCYEINDVFRDTGELKNVMDFLDDLAYTEVIELT